MRSRLRTAATLAAVYLIGVFSAATVDAQAASRTDPELLAKRVSRNLDRVLADARGKLAKLARLPSVRAQDATACNADMAARARSPRYTALGAANRTADLYCLSTPIASPINIADRAYFLRAVGTRDLGVGDFQIGRVTGQGSIGLGFPVLAGKRVMGIVLSPLSLAWLDRRVERRFGRRAFDVLVVDGHGTVLSRAGKVQTRAGRNLGRKSLVRAMLDEDEGEGLFRVNGKRVESAFAAVPRSDGAIRVAVSVRR